MRVTNNMILRNSSYNINGTKGNVNTSMNQMTTQKKIEKPSDDPVVAIRSLRLSTSLSRVDQYYKKNIPDAESWLDVTETALTNMKSLITDVRTQCVNGSTDTLNQDDRNTILKQLKSLQTQLYAEGNADYAGRTVFTGYRTDQDLVYTENEEKTSYNIDQSFTYEDVESFRYYTGNVEVPSTQAEVLGNTISDTTQTNYYRVVSAYGDIGEVNELSFSYETATGKHSVTYTRMMDGTYSQQIRDYAPDGGSYTTSIDARKLVTYESEEQWAAAILTVEEYYPRMKDLRLQYNLSTMDYRISILIKLGVSLYNIMQLTDKSNAYLSTSRSRLYTRIHHIKGGAKDFDQYIQQL